MTIKIALFFGLKVEGLIVRPRHSFVSPLIQWNFGLYFALRDASNDYDIVWAQLDLDGKVRENNNYKASTTDIKAPYIANDAFQGIKRFFRQPCPQSTYGKTILEPGNLRAL